jgi:ribosomal protein S18 acetylase RimI-like enzyme
VWGRFRGLGVGEALTSQVLEYARAGGAHELLLGVYEDNERAVRLYLKMGFEHITRPALEPVLAQETASAGCRRVVMRKRLSAEQAS